MGVASAGQGTSTTSFLSQRPPDQGPAGKTTHIRGLRPAFWSRRFDPLNLVQETNLGDAIVGTVNERVVVLAVPVDSSVLSLFVQVSSSPPLYPVAMQHPVRYALVC